MQNFLDGSGRKFYFWRRLISGGITAGSDKTTAAAYTSLREAYYEGLYPKIKGPFPSQRTVYRWLRRKSAKTTSLIPSYTNRGNRTPRYKPEVSDKLWDLIEQLYARVKSPITAATLTRILNVYCREKGFIGPTQSISDKFVRTFLRENWSSDMDYKRLPYQDARAAKAVATQRIRVAGPLHRVEMDTLHVPRVVNSKHGELEGFWLMVGIDVATGHPLGWHVMDLEPTVADTIACLECCIYSKRKRFDALGIDKRVIDPVGAPRTLVVDNGKENQGQQIDKLASLGISVTRAGTYAGHHKPFIERLWGSLKTALEPLEGSTRYEGQDGTRTKQALLDKLSTVEEAERTLVRWLFEARPNQPLGRFVTADCEVEADAGVTPAQRWSYYEETHFLPDVIPRDDWLAVSFRMNECSLSRKTGVSVKGFTYRGLSLPHLIDQYGSSAKVNVYWNPQDYRTVYVLDKLDGKKHLLVNDELPEQWESRPAYSFREASKRKALYLEAQSIDRYGLARQFEKDMFLPLSQPRLTKRTVRKAAVQNAAREEAARKRAERTPSSSQPDSISLGSSFIADDAIPSFLTTPKTPQRLKKESL